MSVKNEALDIARAKVATNSKEITELRESYTSIKQELYRLCTNVTVSDYDNVVLRFARNAKRATAAVAPLHSATNAAFRALCAGQSELKYCCAVQAGESQYISILAEEALALCKKNTIMNSEQKRV